MSEFYSTSNQYNPLHIVDESMMIQFGDCLAKEVSPGCIIHLDGDLGTGKTTLVRGFLRALGHQEAVKSPTFTIVEPYTIENNKLYNYNKLTQSVQVSSDDLNNDALNDNLLKKNDIKIYHFDLYRLEDPEELEYMGIRDYLDEYSIALIEWPDKGYGVLPKADIIIKINYQEQGRDIELLSQSESGARVVSSLIEKFQLK